MNIYKYTLIALIWAFSLAVNAQTVVYVDGAATGANNGTSWVNAFKELQPAIDAAFIATNGEVWIKAGTYHTTTGTDRTVRFILKDGVSLYGGFDGSETTRIQRDWVSNLTVLSGDIGVANDNSDNTNNLLTVQSTSLNNTIDGLTFRENKNDVLNQPISTVNVLSGKITINNCTFFNNVGVFGSVIASLHSELKLYNSTFYNNKNSVTGLLRADGTGNAEIVNCIFYNNSSTNSGPGVTGGIFGSVPLILINNTFYNNFSNGGGPGALQWSGSSQVLIYNNIFWGNSNSQIAITVSTTASNNIIDGFPLTNNFTFDPQFVDTANGDFTLKPCSSAINSGNNSFLPIGVTEDIITKPRIANGTVDVGAYEYQSLPMSFSAIELGHVSCNGGTNGQISVNVGGGASPFTYNVDGGSFGTNSILTGLAAGSHTVIAKDAFGCEISTTQTITEPATLTIAVISTNVTCNSNEDGIASITVGGGSTPYKIYIDGLFIENLPGNTFLDDELAPGTYTFGIVDANGCVMAASPITITQPPVLTATLTKSNDITCNGADDGSVSVTATGGTAPYQYSIDGTNFQSVNTFENLAPAAYTVEVRDANYGSPNIGCNVTSNSITIIEPTAIGTSIATTDLICAGSQLGEIVVTATGGTTPLEYSIDGTTFQSSSTFSALNGGNYTVTTKDANGCIITNNVALTEPTALNLTSTVVNISCNGLTDGSINSAVTGGTSPYQYSIDGTNFSSTGSFSALASGSYTITIKDANSCTITESITLNEPLELTAVNAVQNISCNGLTDGSVTATASGGTSPYEYSIDDTNFSSTAEFLNLSSGSYTISVKDANNCSVSKDFEITEPAVLSTSLSATDLTCNADQTGEITVSASGGSTPFTYSIDGTNFQSAATFSSLTAGSYTITTKDANGCTSTENITLSEPIILSATMAVENITCNGLTNGSVQITAAGGTTPYEYSIDGTNFSSTNSFANLDTGNFSLTIRDANGCEFTDDITITTPSELVVTGQTNAILCNGDANGSITLTGNGGTSPYEYSIDGTNFQTENAFASLTAGDFTLTILDSKGCTSSTNVTITQPDELTLAASFDGASVSLTATGGTSPYSYSVDGTTFQTSSTFVLGNGQYTFTVKDSNDCEATTTQSLVITALDDEFNKEQVSIYPNPVVSKLYVQGVTANDEIRIFNQAGKLVVSQSTFSKETNLDVGNLDQGIYLLVVVDSNGGVRKFKFIKK